MFSLLMITNNHIMNADMHKGSQFIISKQLYLLYNMHTIGRCQ